MLLSSFNIIFAIRLWVNILVFKPDVIWFHSTIRRIGWLGYVVSKWKVVSGLGNLKIWQMFHDFGYFYPFPHSLTDVKQLPLPLHKKSFLSVAGASIIKRALVFGKYLQLLLLKKFAKQSVDMFLVPSDYMKDIVVKSWGIDKQKVEVLEHFVQE